MGMPTASTRIERCLADEGAREGTVLAAASLVGDKASRNRQCKNLSRDFTIEAQVIEIYRKKQEMARPTGLEPVFPP